MYNNRKTITANEINKFTYCPYQWYYERFYGKKVLRELEKKRNDSFHLTDSRISNFVKGNDYHQNVHFQTFGFGKIAGTILFIAILLFLFFYLKVMPGVQ